MALPRLVCDVSFFDIAFSPPSSGKVQLEWVVNETSGVFMCGAVRYGTSVRARHALEIMDVMPLSTAVRITLRVQGARSDRTAEGVCVFPARNTDILVDMKSAVGDFRGKVMVRIAYRRDMKGLRSTIVRRMAGDTGAIELVEELFGVENPDKRMALTSLSQVKVEERPVRNEVDEGKIPDLRLLFGMGNSPASAVSDQLPDRPALRRSPGSPRAAESMRGCLSPQGASPISPRAAARRARAAPTRIGRASDTRGLTSPVDAED